MAKKAIKPTKEPSSDGEAKTDNSQSTVVQDVKVEVVKAPTLEELESAIEKAGLTFRESGWAFAVAITALHDSKLYPHAGEPNGFYTYMEERWGIKKVQSSLYVAWVKHEIKMELMLQDPALQLEDIKPSQVDSTQTPPPETPKNKGVAASRGARKRVPGKLNEEDAQELVRAGNVVKVGNEYYSKGTPQFEAEMARRKGKSNGDSDKVWIALEGPDRSWQYQHRPLSEVPSGCTICDSKEGAMEEASRILREREAKKKGAGESKGWTSPSVSGVTPEETPPEPSKPYTDDEVVDHFVGWWDEWLYGLRQEDETCTNERVLKIVLDHILTHLLFKDEIMISTFIKGIWEKVQTAKNEKERDEILQEAMAA